MEAQSSNRATTAAPLGGSGIVDYVSSGSTLSLSEAGAGSGSAGGEPSSELHASLPQQHQQRDQHQQQQQRTTTTHGRPPQLSKAAHDAIFGRSASASSPSCTKSPAIVAHEEEEGDYHHFLERLSLRDRGHPVVANVVTTTTTAAGVGGRSQRMAPLLPRGVPTAVVPAPSAAQQAAPSALTIIRRRRSNSTDANGSGSRSSGGRRKGDELGTSSSGRSGGGSSGSDSKGSSRGSSGARQQRPFKLSPKSKLAPAPHDPSDVLQQQQNGTVGGNGEPNSQQPQHGNAPTAMRYNSSLHSTLGGYPMGTPTQLAHPSVTLELLARDRARWEADYYSGYGMDYGYDYGHDYGHEGSYYGPSVRAMSSGVPHQQQLAMRDLERIQGLYQPRQLQQPVVPQQQHHQQQQHQQARHSSDPGGVPAPPASPMRNSFRNTLSEVTMTPNSCRVYQERDYRTDRVWQEDDHSRTSSAAEPPSSSRPERRATEKVSNREHGKIEQGLQGSLPPVPELRGGANGLANQAQAVGQPQGRAGGLSGQQTHHVHQVAPHGIHQGPQSLPPVPQLRAEGGVPVQHQRSQSQPDYPQPHVLHGVTQAMQRFSINEHDIYQASVTPFYQAPTSTHARSMSETSDPRAAVHQLDMLPPGPPIYPNGAFLHPQYGLIYPPTPGGSIASLPPQLAGIYPQPDPRLQGMMYADPQQQMQAATVPQAHGTTSEDAKSHSNTSSESRTSAPVPAAAAVPPSQQLQPKPKKKVSFSHLQIRTYETILGDNPSCSGGPSLGLGWRYDPRHYTATVDEYEAHQARLYGFPDGTPYECRPEDLVLHRFEREAILLNTGYTRQDLADSVRALNKVKNKRRQTVHNLPVAFVEERVEVARRTLRRWMWKKDRTRHMYEEWKKKVGGAGGNNRGSR